MVDGYNADIAAVCPIDDAPAVQMDFAGITEPSGFERGNDIPITVADRKLHIVYFNVRASGTATKKEHKQPWHGTFPKNKKRAV